MVRRYVRAVWVLVVVATVLAPTAVSAAPPPCDVAFDGETLEIECHSDDNLVDVLGLDGNLFVDVINDDVIDLVDLGSAADLTDIKINTAAGEDVVILIGLDVSNSINVNTAGGADRIFYGSNIVGNDLQITTGGGDDLATILGADVGDDAVIRMGGGDDKVEVFLFPIGDFPFEFVGLRAGDDITIHGQGGADTLTGVSEVDAGDNLAIRSLETVV